MLHTLKQILKNNRIKKLYYPAYFILVTVFFLYYLFPSDTIIRHLEYTVQKMRPDLSVTIAGLKPSLLLGLKLDKVNLYYNDDMVLKSDYVRISRGFLSFILPGRVYKYKAKSCDGVLQGKIAVSGKKSGGKIGFETVFKGIQIEKMPFIQQLSNIRISAVLEGKAVSEIDNKKEVSIQAEFSDCELVLAKPIMNLDKFDYFVFSSLKTAVDLTKDEVFINEFDFTGEQINGMLSGQLIAKKPFTGSLLKMNGNIMLNPQFLNELDKKSVVYRLAQNKKGESVVPVNFQGIIGDLL